MLNYLQLSSKHIFSVQHSLILYTQMFKPMCCTETSTASHSFYKCELKLPGFYRARIPDHSRGTKLLSTRSDALWILHEVSQSISKRKYKKLSSESILFPCKSSTDCLHWLSLTVALNKDKSGLQSSDGNSHHVHICGRILLISTNKYLSNVWAAI